MSVILELEKKINVNSERIEEVGRAKDFGSNLESLGLDSLINGEPLAPTQEKVEVASKTAVSAKEKVVANESKAASKDEAQDKDHAKEAAKLPSKGLVE